MEEGTNEIIEAKIEAKKRISRRGLPHSKFVLSITDEIQRCKISLFYNT